MGPHWFAAFLFCAILCVALRLIGTVKGEKAVERQWWLTVAVLTVALVYLVLWALGTSGPFVAWR